MYECTPNQNGLKLTDSRIDQVLAQRPKRLPRHKPGDEFLKGPIPLNWLRQASDLSGKALTVGIAIWFKAGATNHQTVLLGSGLRDKVGLDRKTAYRGLKRLEDAGLVSVVRHVGRCPLVTLLGASERKGLGG